MSTTVALPEVPSVSPADTEPATAYRWRWVVLAIVLVAEVMDLLDATVVTIAGPSVRADIGGGAATIQWLTAGYTLAFAVFLITGARIGDKFGRRRVFVIGAAGFTLSSLLCSVAVSPGMLIASRVLQGSFGALLIPQGFGVIKTVFPQKEIGKAFSVFGPVMGLSAVAAPIIGGALVTGDLLGTGWRMIFLLNLPLGIAAIAGALRYMPESEAGSDVRLDPRGVALTLVGLLCLVFPLVQGREHGWPGWMLVMMAFGVGLLTLFVWTESRPGRQGLIEASLLRNRAFVAGLIVAIAFFAAFIGLMLVISLFTQLGLHYTAIHAGLTLAPMSLGVVFTAGASYPLMARYGRKVIHGGLAISIVALPVLAAMVSHGREATSTWTMAPGLLVLGLGMGLVFGPLFNVILSGVEEHEVGSASGVLNAVQQVGNSVGIAAIGTIFFAFTDAGRLPAGAMSRTTLITAGLFVLTFLLVFLIPKDARMEEA